MLRNCCWRIRNWAIKEEEPDATPAKAYLCNICTSLRRDELQLWSFVSVRVSISVRPKSFPRRLPLPKQEGERYFPPCRPLKERLQHSFLYSYALFCSGAGLIITTYSGLPPATSSSLF